MSGASREDRSSTKQGVSRRVLVRGLAVAGLAATGVVRGTASGASRSGGSGAWSDFGAAVESSFRRLGMVGAAVAVVSADRVLYTGTFGMADPARNQEVTDDTHFLVASTTKSMTSLLVATYVDEGLLAWDQPVRDAWPGFRAPTDDLTRTLRVRDLLGMASGITEPPALSGLHEGDPTAPQLLQSIVNLPVAYPPGKTFFYNNTLYAVGGYLPALAQGVAPADLPATYVRQMQERVFGPAGMSTARIADDPRGVVGRYARGFGLDLEGRRIVMPYGPVGSYMPVGGTLATLKDMAAYVRVQLRKGMSAGDRRVVSPSNLAACWRSHVDIPTSAELDPDAVHAGYGMGWINETYRDGNTFVWHNGGIDGFTTLVGFLPDHDIGLVVLNNMNPSSIGSFFYLSVLNHLFSQRLGLNVGAIEKIEAAYDDTIATLRETWDRTAPVDPAALAPFAGYYEGGYSLVVDGTTAIIRIGPRTMPLRVLPDGTYVTMSGLMPGLRVQLKRQAGDRFSLAIEDVETVNRTVGFE